MLNQIKESLEVTVGHRGDPLDRSPTMRELINTGVVSVGGSSAKPSLRASTVADFPAFQDKPVPAPVGVEVAGTSSAIIVTWADAPGTGHISYAEIAAMGPTEKSGIAPAAPLLIKTLGTSNSLAFSFATQAGQRWRVYVRYVSYFGRVGPWHDVSGSLVQAGDNVGELLQEAWDSINSLEMTDSVITGIRTGTNTSAFQIQSTAFSIVDPDNPTAAIVPFSVVNGVVYANDLIVGTAQFATLISGILTADTVKALDITALELNAPIISGGSITIGTVASSNFTIIDSSGLSMSRASSGGSKMRIESDVIQVSDDDDNVRVKIGNLGRVLS